MKRRPEARLGLEHAAEDAYDVFDSYRSSGGQERETRFKKKNYECNVCRDQGNIFVGFYCCVVRDNALRHKNVLEKGFISEVKDELELTKKIIQYSLIYSE